MKMSRSSLIKLTRVAHRGLQMRAASANAYRLIRPTLLTTPGFKLQNVVSSPRFVSSSSDRKKHITPDGEAAAPEAAPEVVRTPAVITDAEYHEVADAYMERLLTHLEKLEEESTEMDVEYSVRNPSPSPVLHGT